jgi:hypothetical protein
MRQLAVALVLFAAAFSSRAAQLVTESVTQDPISHIYTYHYAVDNTGGSESVLDVAVLVIPGQEVPLLPPLTHTSPPGWTYFTSFGGLNPPTGTFQEWFSGTGVAPGTYLGGFSFSTPFGPVGTTTPNYMLFKSPSNTSDVGIVEAPQLPPPNDVPLLDVRTLIFLAIALAAVATLAMRA